MAEKADKEARFPTFQERFSGERQRLGLSQAEFANLLDISRPTVGFYESGERLPDALVLRKIAQKCKVSCDYLLGLSNNRNFDNVGLGNMLGLTDESLAILKKVKTNYSFMTTLNYLIQNQNLIVYLSNYLLGFVMNKFRESDYRLIPLKDKPLKYFVNIAFSTFILQLPKAKEDIEEKLEKNEKEVELLILDYLRKHADIDDCKLQYNILYSLDSEDDFEEILVDDDFDDLDDIESNAYEEYTEFAQENDIDEDAYNEYNERQMNALNKFLNYLEKGWGGAINGDDPEAGK